MDKYRRMRRDTLKMKIKMSLHPPFFKIVFTIREDFKVTKIAIATTVTKEMTTIMELMVKKEYVQIDYSKLTI